MVAQQQKQRPPAAPVGQAPVANQSSPRSDLRGKSYDEQVQLLSPDGAPQAPVAATSALDAPAPGVAGDGAATKTAAPAAAQAAAPGQAAAAAPAAVEHEKSEADKLREAVAGQAEKWNGKEFMSEEEIENTRKTTGMQNFTTCIEFAGKMMREATGETYGKDWKKAAATTQALIQVKAEWEKGVGEGIKAAAYAKAVANFDKAIADMEGKKAKVVDEIEQLRSDPGQEGEPAWKAKQRTIRADALEKHTVKAYDSVLKQLQGQRDSWQAKVEAAQAKNQDIDAKNTPMIKAADGMGNGRPKEGEYIILSQAPGGGSYGVSKETQVHLAAGAFKHIAIFMGVEKADDGSGVETWRTIDGGGTKGKTTMLFVRLADRMVFPAYQGAHTPEAGTPSKSQVAGWIDMDELVAKRDAKAAGGGK